MSEALDIRQAEGAAGSASFKPSLRNISGNTWEASISLPVVGNVTTEGNGWEEAKMKLWLVSEAVKLLASKQCAHPRDWTEEQWRATLQTMRAVMDSPKESTAAGELAAFKKNYRRELHAAGIHGEATRQD